MLLWRFAIGRALPALIAAVMMPAAAPYAEQAGGLVGAHEPEVILAVARRMGEAEIGRDAMQDPQITGSIDGKDYVVHFHGCKKGRDCTSLQLVARWRSDKLTDKNMGDWNRRKLFGKAYLDAEGNPTVEMNINLFSGVSRGNLDNSFAWWRQILAQFRDFFGFRGDKP